MTFNLASAAVAAGLKRRQLIRPITAAKGTEMDLRRVLFELVRAIYAEADGVVEAAAPLIIMDSPDDIDRAVGGLRAIADRLSRHATNMVNRIVNLRARRFEESFLARINSTMGIDMRAVLRSMTTENQAELALAVQRNASLIHAMSEESIGRIQREVIRGAINGDSHVDVKARLKNELHLSEKRARLIARDQGQKLINDLNRIRQQELGIEKYLWSTSRDERVRKTHVAMEGRTCRWDDPTVYLGSDGKWYPRQNIGGTLEHVGVDINCRCAPIGVIELEEVA